MSSTHNSATVDAMIQAGSSSASSLQKLSFNAHGITTEVVTDSPEIAQAVSSFMKAFRPAGDNSPDIRMNMYGARAAAGAFPGLPPGLPLVYDWGMIRIYVDGDYRYLAIDGDKGLIAADLESATAAGWLDESLLGSEWLISHLGFYPLWGQLLKTRGLFPLHAAGLARDGKAILFPGRSGSGKSTLTLQLVKSGYGLLSDDTVLLRESGDDESVEAMAFPEEINVNEDAVNFFPELSQVKNLTANEARQKSSFAIEELFPESVVEGAKPALLVFPQITDAEKTQYAPMSRTEALTLGLRYAFMFLDPATTGTHFELLSRLARQVRCYRLFSGRDQEDLVRVVERLFTEAEDANDHERGE